MSVKWREENLKKKITIANYVLVFCLLVVMFYQLIFHFLSLPLSKILTTASILPIIMVPYLLDRIFHYQMKEGLQFVFYLFILVSLALGSILGLYHKIAWFDLLAHFLTGVISGVVACIFLEKQGLLRKEKRGFACFFILLFGLGVSSCWEFFEFFSDKLLNGDTQYVKLTGVDDTMEDMLIAFVGSILFSGYCYIKLKKDQYFVKKLEKLI